MSRARSVTLSALTLAAALAAPAAAQVPKVCIPQAVGVPGQPGPPDWFTAGQDPNTRAYTPGDPRWRGAMSLDYGTGTTSDFEIRGLWYQPGGVTTLYLSWYIKTTPDVVTGSTSLFVGIAPKTTNPAQDKANATIIRFKLQQTTTVSGSDWPPEPQATGGVTYFDESVYGWDAVNSRWVTPPPTAPTWIDATARAWIRNVNDGISVPSIGGPVAAPKQNQWVVQLAIPIGPTPGGVNVDPASFRMWHYAQLQYTYSSTQATIPVSWPRTDPLNPAQYVYSVPGGVTSFPDPSIWGEFSTSDPVTAGCGGIKLTTADIGAGANASQIAVDSPNPFYARPENVSSTPVPANTLSADFQFANWGSQVGAVTGASWVSPPPLTGVVDTVGIGANGQGSLTASWTPGADPTWRCKFTGLNGVTDENGVFISGTPGCATANPTLELHQCMLVTLHGPGLNFLSASAFRNMNFVHASSFHRDAEVSVAGLPPLAGGKRDVYLYVLGVNMPEFQFSSGEKQVARSGEKQTPGVAASMVTNVPPPTTVPTFIVRAYHDTGIKIPLEHGDSLLLVPQTSFGYVVQHDGPLEGWLTKTEGVEPLDGGKTHFRISPPNGGSARMSNTIEAVEPKKYSIGLHAGVAIPHGSFASTQSTGFGLRLDGEYFLQPGHAVALDLGWDRFGGKSGGADVSAYRASAAYRYYPMAARLRPFLTAGLGALKLDPGGSAGEGFVGAGGQFLFTHAIAGELTYQLHGSTKSSPKVSWSDLQVGVRYRF